MKYFLLRIIKIILIPVLLFVALFFYWDPFKVFFSYEDYYISNPINGNRDDICFNLFNRRIDKNNISNFIVGSSRSHAYKTNYWSEKILQEPEKCFHYDGQRMGIFRATRAIQYFNKQTIKINNILLIIDTDFFNEISNPVEHTFIQHPDISKESYWLYYWTFIKASFDCKLIIYNAIHNITGKYYDFMGNRLSRSNQFHVSNNVSGDIWYSYDNDIKTDSTKYYDDLIKLGVFYNREISDTFSVHQIHDQQYIFLNDIKNIVIDNHASIKIVISPLYNQKRFNQIDKQILIDLFGKDCVFDFSGVNKFTSDLTNYYESSHYKPYVANKIMDIVYP